MLDQAHAAEIRELSIYLWNGSYSMHRCVIPCKVATGSVLACDPGTL